MARRLRSWLRTSTKLVLLVLVYFWVGAAYKLVYAQTHDLSKYQQPPLSYYQRHFLIEWLMHQSWIFGPDFLHYIGDGVPLSLAAGMATGANPQLRLAEFCAKRERELSALPGDYPRSLFAPVALQDAWLYSQGSSMLGALGGRDRPERALSQLRPDGVWMTFGLPSVQQAENLSRRLADEFPESQQAPTALLRVAEAERGKGHQAECRALYRRIAVEYARSDEAEAAATALYNEAVAAGKLEAARRYRERALEAAERRGRERFVGRALPAKTEVTLLGYRIDLSSLDLRLQRVKQAKDEVSVVTQEVQRLTGLRDPEREVRDRLNDARSRLDRTRTELWVADLFDSLKVGAPGPPPRPHEFPVSGTVTLNGRPFEGADVMLNTEGGGDGIGALLGQGGEVPFRARSDRKGRLTIGGVPSGSYRLRVVYPTLESGGGAPIVPLRPTHADDGRIVVKDGATILPPIRLASGVKTDTFGSVNAADDRVPLAWEPWPDAKSYRVEVLVPSSAIGGTGAFEQRVPLSKRGEFQRHPVLWKGTCTGHTIACPLLPLAPDQPEQARIAQYEYRVTALDRKGQALAASSDPFSRFNLSDVSLRALQGLHPPRRGPRRFRGRLGPRARRRPQ